MADNIKWDDEIQWDDQPEQPAPKQPDSFLSRAVTGLMDPVYGAAQIADKVINPIRQFIAPGASSMDDVIREREAGYNAPEGIDAARIVGNVVNPVSWMGGGAGVGRAAAQGAFQSALAPTNPDGSFVQQKAMQTGLGAAGGAVLAKTLRGFTPTKEAQALIDQGVQPSFGQSMGGITNNIEQKLTSVPIVGDAVRHARIRPLSEMQQQVIARRSHGQKTLDEADAYASSLYERTVPHLKPTKEAEVGVRSAMQAALSNPELTDANRQMLAGMMTNQFGQNFSRFKQLDGPAIKRLDSQLGHLARKYAAGDPASKTLADEIYNVRTALREGLDSGLPEALAQDLKSANEIWRNLIPLHKAASQRADERIMPRALQKAIAKQQGVDVSRLNHDPLIHDALKVLPQTIPDSGTAERLLMGSAGLMGSGAFGLLPHYLAAGAIAGVGATRPVQRSLVGNTGWQKALSPFDATAAAVMAAALSGHRK